MKLAAAVAGGALALVVSGCGAADGPADTAERTRLTVTLHPAGDAGAAHRWTLRCDPAEGDHPDPAGACAALDALDEPFAETPADEACTEIYGGPATAHVSGTHRGRRVETRFGRENGCEIDRWTAHEPLLDPDRQAADPAAGA